MIPSTTSNDIYEALALLELRLKETRYQNRIRQRYNEIVASVRYTGNPISADRLVELDARASRMIHRRKTSELDRVAFLYNASKLMRIPPPFTWRSKVTLNITKLADHDDAISNVVNGPW